jgi:protein-tyrosine phosphatase
MNEPAQTRADAADDLFAQATAARLMPLEGGLNFRDLGGYRTADGRRVRRGRLYRSGSLSGLTQADCAQLTDLGLRTVCDLRTTSERTREPNLWVEAAALAHWTRDYEMSFGELRRVMAERLDADRARRAMITVYEQLPFEQAPAYSELFRRIAAGEIPLVFHCSAGKDRAGTAAALILSALGVPRETVVADYLLSDELARPRLEARQREAQAQAQDPMAAIPTEALRVVLGAQTDFIEAAFGVIEARHGSLRGYLAEALGVDEPMLQEIRGLLLE